MKKTGHYSKSQLLKMLSSKEKKITALKAEIETLKKNVTLIPDNEAEIFSLKEIIALMPGNVFWKNKEGQYLGCNNNLAKFLGFHSPDQIVGKRNEDFIAENYARLLNQIDDEIMVSKEGRFIEETGLDQNNQPTVFFTHKIPILNRLGNSIGLLGISLDITEHKKMEAELKQAKEKAEISSRAKSQFLAVINHELRTPLTCIIGLLNFLKQDNLSTEEEKKVISAIDNSTQYLLNLVNDVLDFSKLETGKYNLRIHPIHIETVIHEVYDLLKPLSDNKDLELRIHHSTDIPKYILTDAHILRQILINLVNNAIKFTEKGSITIQVNSLKRNAHHIKLEIIVSDTGIGMPADKLDLIFEPFQQLEDAYTRQSSRSGTGLGLSIVKKLAEMIDGEIHVVSKQGRGSSFSLIAEFQMPSEEMSPTALTLESTLAKTGKKQDRKTILFEDKQPNILHEKTLVLLIEDDPIVQYIHKKMLADLGCHVDCVARGNDAIQSLDKHHIVFVDLNLPDISGFDVIKLIRKRTDSQHIPIVALTAFTGREEKTASLNAGADAFVNKPVSQTKLKKLLQRYLGKIEK